MPRNGLSGPVPVAPFCLPVGVASTACAPSLFRDFCVLFGKFVAVFAMSFRFLSRSVSHSTKSKPWSEYTFFCIENFRKRKPQLCSFDYSVSLESAQISKINCLIGDSVNCNCSGYALIPLLFASCRPSAIPRFVITIVVEPIKHVAGRLVAHIGSKVFKCLPSIANRYSSSSIVAPLAHRRVFATVDHPFPCTVKRVPTFRLFCGHALSIAHMA